MNWLDILLPIVKHKDRRSPVYLRITDCLRRHIQNGSMHPDERLPTDRELSKQLGIDRSTIARAYDLLESEGFIYSHVGRGTFVKSLTGRQADQLSSNDAAKVNSRNALRYLPLSSAVNDSEASEELAKNAASNSRGDYSIYNNANRIIWADKFSRASQTVAALANRQPLSAPAADCISFASGIPSAEFFPQKDFNDIVSALLERPGSADMFSYSQSEGHPFLRKEVLAYLQKQGITAKDEQLLILSGSQQGIDLVARTLVDQDDVVLLEDPTYFWATCNFAFTGARCVPVSSDHEGIRLDAFENAASSTGAKLLYLMPSFQNPCGTTMPIQRRKQLLNIARRYQVPILEDNFAGDLCYEVPQRSLFNLDAGIGTVIYQGTFSKALCPGLRLGWLVAPEQVMARLRLAKRTADLSTNSMSQIILAEYLRRGLYEERLSGVVTAYRQRLDMMCAQLASHAAEWLSWQRPAGGMFLWTKLPPGYSSRELLAFAEREGVTFSPGDVFNVSGGRSEYLRLTFIQQNCQRIEAGVTRLARALKAYSGSRKKLQRADGSYRIAEANFI